MDVIFHIENGLKKVKAITREDDYEKYGIPEALQHESFHENLFEHKIIANGTKHINGSRDLRLTLEDDLLAEYADKADN